MNGQTTSGSLNINNILDRDVLGAVVAESLAQINPARPDAKRWVNAVTRATVEIENNPLMSYEPASHSLLVMSSSTGTTYEANGVCQCRAFEQGHPCWHRAAARLVAKYLDCVQ